MAALHPDFLLDGTDRPVHSVLEVLTRGRYEPLVGGKIVAVGGVYTARYLAA